MSVPVRRCLSTSQSSFLSFVYLFPSVLSTLSFPPSNRLQNLHSVFFVLDWACHRISERLFYLRYFRASRFCKAFAAPLPWFISCLKLLTSHSLMPLIVSLFPSSFPVGTPLLLVLYPSLVASLAHHPLSRAIVIKGERERKGVWRMGSEEREEDGDI